MCQNFFSKLLASFYSAEHQISVTQTEINILQTHYNQNLMKCYKKPQDSHLSIMRGIYMFPQLQMFH